MENATSSLARMLAILDLYTMEKTEWTVEEIAGTLSYSVSTTYRYVRELSRIGLLAKMPGASYVIGAKAIELDRLVRHADPLSNLAKPILREISTQTGCTALLVIVYGEHLVNVIHEDGLEILDLTYLRGVPMPWFQGAPGKAALAFLPTARARHLFEKHDCADGFDESRWRARRTELRKIRQAGYSYSAGELEQDQNFVGFGVPLLSEGEVIGSISTACSRSRAAILSQEGLIDLLKSKAQELEALIRERRSTTQ